MWSKQRPTFDVLSAGETCFCRVRPLQRALPEVLHPDLKYVFFPFLLIKSSDRKLVAGINTKR